MKHLLFAAATTLLAATGAQATIAFPDFDMPSAGTYVSGPAVAGQFAEVGGATFERSVETAVSQDAMTLYHNISSDGGAPNSYSFNRASGGASVGAVFDPASSATLPEPSSWLLAAAGFCALAAFSGRKSNRDLRTRLYVPEDAMVIASGRAS